MRARAGLSGGTVTYIQRMRSHLSQLMIGGHGALWQDANPACTVSRGGTLYGTAGPLRQAGQQVNPPGMRPGGFTAARYGT